MREAIRDIERLRHILSAIDRILNNTSSMKVEDLHESELVYYGIVKNIEIIGEAAYKLTRDFKESHPDTPWDYIVKMRHVLVHDYYQINDDDLWMVISSDLNPLRSQVKEYIETTDWEQWAGK